MHSFLCIHRSYKHKQTLVQYIFSAKHLYCTEHHFHSYHTAMLQERPTGMQSNRLKVDKDPFKEHRPVSLIAARTFLSWLLNSFQKREGGKWSTRFQVLLQQYMVAGFQHKLKLYCQQSLYIRNRYTPISPD